MKEKNTHTKTTGGDDNDLLSGLVSLARFTKCIGAANVEDDLLDSFGLSSHFPGPVLSPGAFNRTT